MFMGNKRATEQIADGSFEKTRLIAWVKRHKLQLLFAGVSVTTVAMTLLGVKNKDEINQLWNSLIQEIKKGSLYSAKWFENASLEELREVRKIVQQDYRNPDFDLEYRSECWELLKRFDNAIGKIVWQGKEKGYPVSREHGWYL